MLLSTNLVNAALQHTILPDVSSVTMGYGIARYKHSEKIGTSIMVKKIEGSAAKGIQKLKTYFIFQ